MDLWGLFHTDQETLRNETTVGKMKNTRRRVNQERQKRVLPGGRARSPGQKHPTKFFFDRQACQRSNKTTNIQYYRQREGQRTIIRSIPQKREIGTTTMRSFWFLGTGFLLVVWLLLSTGASVDGHVLQQQRPYNCSAGNDCITEQTCTGSIVECPPGIYSSR